MAVTISLPQVGESVVEGTIGKWLKRPGDRIARYEPLVEVVTDKVTMELPSPVAGSLLRILAQEGQTVPMGAPIAEVETSETPAGAVSMAAPAQVAPLRTPAATPPGGITSYLIKDARPMGPTGGGPTSEEAAPEAPAPPAPAAEGESTARMSPAVRRLAQEHGVNLSQVQGTGLGGRITRDDVLKHVAAGQAAPAPPAAAPSPTPAASAAIPGGSPSLDEEYITLTPVRRMIAEAMVRSASQIPHAWSAVEVDVSHLVALRAQVRAAFEAREGVDLTYLPFVIKALAEALKEFPTLNASWGGDKIVLKKRINVGIAVAAPQGLVVPVVRDADRQSIAGLARAARELTQRARQNKLVLEDVHGGTFTLNNTGALGSVVSKPIINFPQAAILTFEAIQKRAVVRDDAIAIRSMMNLCLSFDHRINDGAQAGGFLQAVKRRLEAMGPGTQIY
ncbi:MAG: 2-oxo acid dehydrogenase subunit E2 [Dehalococcoidia bacterium]|nr:2-oxo acid dehydrogenase subunit E2 [Dehalococcoidia bacterium]